MTKVVSKCEEVIDMSMEGIQQLKKQSAEYDKDNIIRCINILSELEGEARWSSNPRILLEVALVKMCRTGVDISQDGLLARIASLEAAISKGSFTPMSGEKQQSYSAKASGAEVQKKEQAAPAKAKAALKPENQDIIQKWPGFMQDIKGRGKIKLRTYLSMAKPSLGESGMLVLSYEKEDIFSKEAIEAQANKTEVEAAASEYFGLPIRIKCVMAGEAEPEESEDNEDIVKAAIELVGIDNVEVIEEE